MSQSGYTRSQRNIAHQAVAYAVKTGRLSNARTQTCVSCGGGADIWHHHKGYAEKNKLNVVAICRRCHAIEHNGGTHKVQLSGDEVKQARKMYRLGVRIKHIATFFGYSSQPMGKIVKGESYKWVD